MRYRSAMMRYGFSGCGDVCAGAENEVSGEAAEADLKADLEADGGAALVGLKTTAAHVFDGVAGEVRGEADFDDEPSLVGGVLNDVSMLLMADNERIDESEAGGEGEVDVKTSFSASDCFFA